MTRIAPIQGSESGIIRAIRVIRGFFDLELGLTALSGTWRRISRSCEGGEQDRDQRSRPYKSAGPNAPSFNPSASKGRETEERAC
jgi:hypothetical protein